MTTFDEAYEELRGLHEAYDASDGTAETWRAFQNRRTAFMSEGGQAGQAARRYAEGVQDAPSYWGCW